MKKIFVLLLAIYSSSMCYSQRFDIDTISMTGSVDDRINLVFLPDGYQENELDKFIDDVHWMENALLGISPYKEYRAYFNSFAIKVPSNVSGAAEDPSNLIDNYFGSSFNSSGIWRLVVPHRSYKAQDVLRDNFPKYDQVIMIVNDSRYGGSGGWLATSTTNTAGPEICIHEIGHSFAKLADEYWAGEQYAREKVNMTRETDREAVKWERWLDYRNIGIYMHSESPEWQRPHQNCEMRYLNREFCSVCQEAITDKILDLTSPVIDYYPADSGFTQYEPEMEFSIKLIEPSPNTMNVRWSLNNNIIAKNTDTLRLSSDMLNQGENKVIAFILDTTNFIRSSSHSLSHLHKLVWEFNNGTSGLDLTNLQKNRIDLKLFPNPAVDFVEITGYISSDTELGMKLLSNTGRLIELYRSRTRPAGEFKERLDLARHNLPSGLYHIIISVEGLPLYLPLIIN